MIGIRAKTEGNMEKSLHSRIAERYGSRQGLVLTYKYRLLHLTGMYRKYTQIDWGRVERVVFICKGNICRSAFAEIVAQMLDIDTISCGIETDDGMQANEKAMSIAADKGFNMAEHRTRKISSIEIQKTDLMVAMEPYQIKYLEKLIGDGYAYTLMGLWGRPSIPYIHDPFGAPGPYFDNCFAYIESCVHAIGQKIYEAKQAAA